MPRAGIGVGSRVTIIGLGRFGRSVAQTAHDLGYEVLAIDLDDKLIDAASRYSALAVEGDGTDEELLRSLQVERSDVAIVAQSSNLEASILSTMLVKKLGVPYVISKAQTDLHGEVLRAVGADRMVFPESDEGAELAHSLAVPSIQDYISLSPTSGVAKIEVPWHMVGQSVSDILKTAEAKVSLLLIYRGHYLIATPSFNERIEGGDELVVAGPDVEIERLMSANAGGASE